MPDLENLLCILQLSRLEITECALCFRPKRNKDDPIDQLKHFFWRGGRKAFLKNNIIIMFSFSLVLEIILELDISGGYSPIKVTGALVGKFREHA